MYSFKILNPGTILKPSFIQQFQLTAAVEHYQNRQFVELLSVVENMRIRLSVSLSLCK